MFWKNSNLHSGSDLMIVNKSSWFWFKFTCVPFIWYLSTTAYCLENLVKLLQNNFTKHVRIRRVGGLDLAVLSRLRVMMACLMILFYSDRWKFESTVVRSTCTVFLWKGWPFWLVIVDEYMVVLVERLHMFFYTRHETLGIITYP